MLCVGATPHMDTAVRHRRRHVVALVADRGSKLVHAHAHFVDGVVVGVGGARNGNEAVSVVVARNSAPAVYSRWSGIDITALEGICREHSVAHENAVIH